VTLVVIFFIGYGEEAKPRRSGFGPQSPADGKTPSKRQGNVRRTAPSGVSAAHIPITRSNIKTQNSLIIDPSRHDFPISTNLSIF